MSMENEDKQVTENEAPETENVKPEIRDIPYHQRYYLLFGHDTAPEGLAITETKTFLTDILKYNGGALRQARDGKESADAFSDNLDENVERCSYCGAAISGVDYHRLPDGRNRCTNCSRSMITTLEDLNRIFSEVTKNLELFLSAKITVPIAVEMTEERKLKKKIKVSLNGADGASLILGVAVHDKNEYRVYLENGAPRISVISTIAHEMVHIWQYTHWDQKAIVKKYGKANRLFIYEGMAKWAEIQYLYLIGEKTVAAREEFITRHRDDEYGKGFNLFVDQYPLSKETMVIGATPFLAGNEPLIQFN